MTCAAILQVDVSAPICSQLLAILLMLSFRRGTRDYLVIHVHDGKPSLHRPPMMSLA